METRELANGMTLAFDRNGPTDTTPVVLLHGLSSSRLAYAAVVDHLSHPSGGRPAVSTIAVDMRGHGQSARSSLSGYDATSYADDIVLLLTALGCGPALIVGHSLGGVVAAEVARVAPGAVRAVFLEDPPLFEGDDARRAASPVASFFPILVAEVRALQAVDAPPSAYAPFALDMPPSDAEERRLTLSLWDPTTMEAAINGAVWHGFDPTAYLSVPTTLLRADPNVGAVFSAADEVPFLAANPHARVVMVEGAGHSIRSGATQAAYLAELDRWISNLVSA
jgi:pimeloyl-ACP methyl ester carboxylesterase